jgi:hypothetical protein
MTCAWLAAAVQPATAQIYAWRDDDGHLVVSDHERGGASKGYAPTGTTYQVADSSYRATRPSTNSARYADIIREHAGRHGLSPDLVTAVIQVESAFNPRALSPKGAMGLMQLMPSTATEYGVMHPFDPDENIGAGVAYLRRLMDRYDGRVELALAAYNAGPGAVDKYGETVPPYQETRNYVRKIKSVTPISLGARRVIYKIVEIVDGREVPRYSDEKPEGDYTVVTRR